MFGIFKKNTKEDKRDLEQVIFDIAEHNQDKDYFRMYELLKDRELYLPADPNSLPEDFVPGSRLVTDSSHQIRISNAKGPNGELLIPAVTTESHPTLQGGYIGMRWSDFLEMVLKIPEAWGALIQGETSYVGFDRERIKYILESKNV
jgi:hypothetical protein